MRSRQSVYEAAPVPIEVSGNGTPVPQGRRRLRQFRFSMLSKGFLFVLLVSVLPSVGVKEAGSLLVKRNNPQKADVIVVLGGENESRAAKAIELYRRGFAPKVLVTGKNEGEWIGKRLVEAGVPENAIYVEPSADSTFENASLSLPILKGLQTRTVLLVTSWYHSRRATSVFEAGGENIEFISVPTKTDSYNRICKDNKLLESILMEYVKIAGYWVIYGIDPIR